MASPPPHTIAVLFATKGGMGDVGKFAAAQASKAAEMNVRIIALYSTKCDGAPGEIDVDITQEVLRNELKADFSNISYKKVDVDDPAAAQAEVEGELDGVEAVVACLGSRQPGIARWCATGAGIVVEAMKKKGVERLVHLSSMGIGDDFVPVSGVKVFWSCLLNVPWRGMKNDLVKMEGTVRGSGLDYLLVRSMVLTPKEPPRGSWKLLQAKGEGALGLSIAKADVAAFMLQEATGPTLSKRAVTIGQPRE